MVITYLFVTGAYAMDDADTFGGIPVCHLDRMVVEHVFQFHGSNHVFIYSVSVFFLAAGVENFESRGN